MTRAIVLREHGGPAALVPEEVSVGEPGQGEILVHQSAVDVNFHDVYVRSGLYRTLALGRGVEAVSDAVGRDTFAESLESLAYCGALVNYGQPSGPADPIAPAALGAKSNSLSRPVVFHYLRQRSALEARRTTGAVVLIP